MPRLAVATLRDVVFQPSLLYGVASICRKALNSGDGLVPNGGTGREQDRMAWPSKWIVQAPHCPMPQPYLVPTSCRWSRSTHSTGVSGATSTVLALPLMLSLKLAIGVMLNFRYRFSKYWSSTGLKAIYGVLASDFSLPRKNCQRREIYLLKCGIWGPAFCNFAKPTAV